MQLQLFKNNPKPETRHKPVFDGSRFFVRTLRFRFSHSCCKNLIDSLIYKQIWAGENRSGYPKKIQTHPVLR